MKNVYYLPKLPKNNIDTIETKYNLFLYRKIPSQDGAFLKKRISYTKPYTYRCRNTL